jgi:hypothetical protein
MKDLKNWLGAIAIVMLLMVAAGSTSSQIRGAREPNPATGEIYSVHSRKMGTIYVTKADRDSTKWLAGIGGVAIVSLIILRLTGWKPVRSKAKQ